MMRHLLLGLLVSAGLAAREALTIRMVAANLTSDRKQAYSPDNTNHSNPEGAGARILKALKPDVVMIQEFTTNIPVRQWINRTLGKDFAFSREEETGLPNGIISRFPVVASGSWDDPVLENREFAWARLRLSGDRDLWVVSLHLHSKGETSRATQAAALAGFIRGNVPAGALLAVGGDFNTRRTDEACFSRLAGIVVRPEKPPADHFGNIATNQPRNRPYDWVLASEALERHAVAVKLAGESFPHGLVFDTRVFPALEKCPPAQAGDSGLPFMQHMAVLRDFRIP